MAFSSLVTRFTGSGVAGDIARRADGSSTDPVRTISFLFKHLPVLFLVAVTLTGCSIESAATRPQGGNEYLNQGEYGGTSTAGSLRPQADSLTQGSVIRPGDQIQLTVWGYPEFNTTTTVKGYGTITVPLIGEVIAAGLTVRQLSAQLEQRLSQYVKGKVKLTISHIGINQRISVMGAVNRQGNYPALSELSLVQVLADAGGTTSGANLKDVRIYRRGMRTGVINVNLIDYLQNGNIQYVPMVGPGDVVFVPKQKNFVKSFSVYATEIIFLFSFFALLR